VAVDSPQLEALERLAALEACLRQGGAGVLAPLVDEIAQPARSVESFHMEAIRFRLFGLRRRLTTYDGTLPAGALDLLEQAAQALAAAGFRTR